MAGGIDAVEDGEGVRTVSEAFRGRDEVPARMKGEDARLLAAGFGHGDGLRRAVAPGRVRDREGHGVGARGRVGVDRVLFGGGRPVAEGPGPGGRGVGRPIGERDRERGVAGRGARGEAGDRCNRRAGLNDVERGDDHVPGAARVGLYDIVVAVDRVDGGAVGEGDVRVVPRCGRGHAVEGPPGEIRRRVLDVRVADPLGGGDVHQRVGRDRLFALPHVEDKAAGVQHAADAVCRDLDGVLTGLVAPGARGDGGPDRAAVRDGDRILVQDGVRGCRILDDDAGRCARRACTVCHGQGDGVVANGRVGVVGSLPGDVVAVAEVPGVGEAGAGCGCRKVHLNAGRVGAARGRGGDRHIGRSRRSGLNEDDGSVPPRARPRTHHGVVVVAVGVRVLVVAYEHGGVADAVAVGVDAGVAAVVVADVAGVPDTVVGVGDLFGRVTGVFAEALDAAGEGVGPDVVVVGVVFRADLVGVAGAGVVVDKVAAGVVPEADAALGVAVAGVLGDRAVSGVAAEVDAVVALAAAVVADDQAVVVADALDRGDVFIGRAAGRKAPDGDAVCPEVEDRLRGHGGGDGDVRRAVLGHEGQSPVDEHVLGVGAVLHDDGVARSGGVDRRLDGGVVPALTDVPGLRFGSRAGDDAVLPRSRQGCVVGAEAVREDVGCVEDAVAVRVGCGVARPEVADEAGVLNAVVGVGDGGGGVPVSGGRGGAGYQSDAGDVVVLVDPVVLAGALKLNPLSIEQVPDDGVVGCRCFPDSDGIDVILEGIICNGASAYFTKSEDAYSGAVFEEITCNCCILASSPDIHCTPFVRIVNKCIVDNSARWTPYS